MTYYNRKTNSIHEGEAPTNKAIIKTIVDGGVIVDKIIVNDDDWKLIDDKPSDDYYYNGFQWLPIPIVKIIPQSISRRQVHLQLLAIGKLTEVETYITNSSDEILKLEWMTASTFERNNPTLNSVTLSMGLDSEMVDNFFIEASKL